MAHARETIRKAIKSAITGLTTSGARVRDWSLYAKGPLGHPALSLEVGSSATTPSETVDNEFGDGELRDLPFVVEARAVQAISGTVESLEDTLDDMCLEVEVALAGNKTLGLSYVHDMMLVATTIEVSGDGEAPVGKARMEWLLRYSTDKTDPSA